MPKIGNYTPNEPFQQVIQSSPGPVSAPSLPDTGSALAEGNIRNASQTANNIAETGALMRRDWLSPIGAAGAGIVEGIGIQRAKHAAATEKMHKLYNDNLGGTAANNLIGSSNTILGDYNETNKNNVEAYSKDNTTAFMKSYDENAAIAKTAFMKGLQGNPLQQQEAINVYDAASRGQRNTISKGLDNAKYGAMEKVVQNNDANLVANTNTLAATDLPAALLSLDSPANKLIMDSAGTYYKLSS